MTYVVTISATYGAGGGTVGPAVARRLGVPFLDRAVPGAVAREIGCSLEAALEYDDRAPSGLERLLAGVARPPAVTLGSVDTAVTGAADATGRLVHDREFVERTEQVIASVARSGGVVLGRAAAVVLAGDPRALHVRLDGPASRRLEQATALWNEGHPEEPARSRTGRGPAAEGAPRPPALRDLEDNDRARAAYVRRFYRVDAAAPDHYHLWLDSTALPLPVCVDLIERAARGRAERGPDTAGGH